MPRVSNTVLRGRPSGSQVFIGSFEWPVPTSVSGLLSANNFSPSGVSGGISPRLGVRLPAQEPVMSWTGAGPPGVGSGLSRLPLYKPSLLPGFGPCASATAVHASTTNRAVTYRAGDKRISRIPSLTAAEFEHETSGDV